MTSVSAPALRLESLTGYYGPVPAVRSVQLSVERGECVGVIGSNGAGKSTLLKAAVGLIRTSGDVVLNGERLGRAGTASRRRIGLALVPQERVVLVGLTVFENLRLSWLTGPKKRSFKVLLDQVVALFPILAGRMPEPAGNLSGGQRQMLAVARGLMSEPKVLLLDEPTAGLAPVIVEQLTAALRQLSNDGLTMVLVEQNLFVARSLSNRLVVLAGGDIAWSGRATDLDRTKVADLYLGG